MGANDNYEPDDPRNPTIRISKRRKSKKRIELELTEIREATRVGMPLWKIRAKLGLSIDELKNYITKIVAEDAQLYPLMFEDPEHLKSEALLLRDRLNEVLV